MKLVISNIRKTYGDRTVLKDCSTTFDGSGVAVLMGPNGCGKSTLLRICSLLEPADGGDLLFTDNEKPLAIDLMLRRRMTLVLPKTGVFNMPVFDNAAYGLRIRGFHQQLLETKVREVLAFVGLEHKAKQNARTLSSGETQRLGIARALAIDPDLLFLDEPTASVDEENTGIIESLIVRLKKEIRTMVIIATHDREQARRVADRLLVLEHGVLRESPW